MMGTRFQKLQLKMGTQQLIKQTMTIAASSLQIQWPELVVEDGFRRGFDVKGADNPLYKSQIHGTYLLADTFLAMTPALGQPVDFSKMTPTTAATKLV